MSSHLKTALSALLTLSLSAGGPAVPGMAGEAVPLTNADPPRRVTLDDFLSALHEKFPLPHEIKILDDGSRRFPDVHPALSVVPPTEIHDEVMTAKGPVFAFPDGKIEVVAFQIGFSEESRTMHMKRAGIWRLDGTPYPEQLWPVGETPSSVGGPLNAEFLIRIEGDLEIFPGVYRSGMPELLYSPTEFRVADCFGCSPVEPRYNNTGRLFMVGFDFGPPIAGPLEFRISVLRNVRVGYSLANEPGAYVCLSRECVQFSGTLRGTCKPHAGREVKLLPQWGIAGNLQQRTCAMFAMGQDHHYHDPHWYKHRRVTIQAVGKDGTVYDPSRSVFVNDYRYNEFPCASEEIAEFRITDWPRIDQVRFTVQDIPWFPRENRSLDDLLDLRMVIRPHHPNIINLALRDGDMVSRMPNCPEFDVSEPIDAERPTLRELLDHHYPGRWYVEDGKIRFRQRRK